MGRDEDDGELGSRLQDEGIAVGIETADQLDLNVDQECAQFSDSSKYNANNDGVLKIGTEFDSDEHAYRYYNKYAKLLGFSVRKDWVNRSKVHGLVVSRKYTCSKEGYRRKDKRDVNVKKHRKETRTGCLAHMIVTRKSDGKYRVTHFEAEHNHDDINPNDAQALLLQQELCVDQSGNADFPSNLGTLSCEAFELMNRKLEMQDSLDYLAMDFDNYLRSERTRDTKEGEVGRLLRYFQRQRIENPLFFYSMQVDIDDKVSNMFWADDKMIIDYNHFGDVVCLDTMSRTNKHLQPFVQFIGVNHHNQAIIFAAALMFDETVESFKWLLSSFLEAMGGKKPNVILTDQDATMVEAINLVLSATNHGVCVWQMYQNALRHLSRSVKDTQRFANDLRNCIYDHSNEESFVHAWEGLLDTYDLQQNEWLRWIFREREKWAIAYSKNSCFVDTKGANVAEDFHKNLTSHLNSDHDVLQFFRIFERMVDEQRVKEIQASDEMSRCFPRLMGNLVTLKHASEIYTPKAFEIFQKEYEKCLNIVVTECSENGFLLEYKVKTFGQTREYTVTFNSSDDTVFCSCMSFENVGFLCAHALKVLDYRNIKVVPSKYISKRWTKDARVGRGRECSECIGENNPKLVAASRYKDLSRSILNIAAIAAESDEAFEFASRQLDEVIEGVEKILALKSEVAQGITSSSTGANGSESENAECFLDEKEDGYEDDAERVEGTREKDSSIPEKHQLKTLNDKISKKKRFEIERSPSLNTINCVSSPSPACVSNEIPTPNPLLQGLYSFETNQVIHGIYQPQNSGINNPDHPTMYQQSNIYSDRHDSPGQTPLLQGPLIRCTHDEPLTGNTQVMDLDVHPPHSSSFLLYDNRSRASSDTSYLRP